MTLDPDGEGYGTTVSQVLSGIPEKYWVLGGDEGLDRVVREVAIFGAPEANVTAGNVLLVLDGSSQRNDTYQIDVALRAAAAAQASALVLVTWKSLSVGLAPIRLANKLAVPLILVDTIDVLAMVDRIRQVVTAPQLVAARSLLRAIAELRRTSNSPSVDASLNGVAERLSLLISLVDVEGFGLAGPVLDPPLEVGELLPVAMTSWHGRSCQLVQPIHFAPRERPSFWLVCRRENAGESWASAAADILQIASWAVGMKLAGERVDRERDARVRLGVLNQIVASGETHEPALMEQIGVLGWHVDGWCSAVHVQVSGDSLRERLLAISDDFARNLLSAGLSTPLVERPDGWTLWVHTSAEPSPGSYIELARTLSSVAHRFVKAHPGLRLHLGIGLPHFGINGLRSSLTEAREASVIAQAGGGTAVVRHIDELGVRRILFGWYTSENFAVFARTLLEPLRSADPGGDLIVTLEIYLDCHASPTQTAEAMHLHRNTILNRMERIRSLLSVDLGRPDERLAVHLACRLLRLQGTPE
jgi:purine catabolism regulator